MRRLLLFVCVSSPLFAQSPREIVRRFEARRAAAARAVAQASTAERSTAPTAYSAGSVSVLAGLSEGSGSEGLAVGVAELLTRDLSIVHGVHPVERIQAQAIVRELAREGVDERQRPRAWMLVGAERIVIVDAARSGDAVVMTARVVDVARQRADAVTRQSGTVDDLFNTERRLALDVLRALGVEPTSSERRAILERPASRVEAFLAFSAALDAIESGDAPRAERLLRTALETDAGINAAFDATVLASTLSATLGGGAVPMPSGAGIAGDDPSEAGLATEGNESEYGEQWFEGSGDKRLNVYEFAVPLSVSQPLGRGRLDLSTVWASNRVDTPANDVFHSWGFTDIHVRYTQAIARSGVSFAVGGVLPARDVHGTDDDIRRVPLPPDLLPAAIYRRRNAPAASAGLFFTRSLGAWNAGGAAGGEWNSSYDELSPSLHTVAVAPGARWRLRADAERSLGAGRLAVGASLMSLSPATRAGVDLRGGARRLARGSYAWAMGPVDLDVGAWRLWSDHVLAGGVEARPASSITAYFASAHAAWRGWMLDAGFEAKEWRAGSRGTADLLVPQVNFTHALGRALLAEVGADYVHGHFHEAPSTTDIPVRGWMIRAGLRVEP